MIKNPEANPTSPVEELLDVLDDSRTNLAEIIRMALQQDTESPTDDNQESPSDFPSAPSPAERPNK